ncbi:MAG TPA: hypothetical protein VIK81_01765 [Patescibacteria group bacterium]
MGVENDKESKLGINPRNLFLLNRHMKASDFQVTTDLAKSASTELTAAADKHVQEVTASSRLRVEAILSGAVPIDDALYFYGAEESFTEFKKAWDKYADDKLMVKSIEWIEEILFRSTQVDLDQS